MRGKKTLLAVLLVLLVLAAGIAWILLTYHVVGFHLYPKDAAVLDLRERDISIEDYETLAEKMPDCVIRWNMPFQGGVLADDTTEVTITSLTDEDVAALAHLTQLNTVDAKGCTDYDQLMLLKETCPETKVDYVVWLGGTAYDGGSTRIDVSTAVPREETGKMRYLTQLERVVLCGNTEAQDFSPLREYCLNNELELCVSLGGEILPYDTKEVTVSAITDGELALLANLSELSTLHIRNPEASPEKLFALREAYPNTQTTWEVDIAGETFADTVTEVDLSMMVIEDLAEVEAQVAYLPNVEKVIFGLCGLDEPKWGNSKSKLAVSELENEDLSAYRDRVREDYKVVWTVRLGPSIALRTDADNFMPNHFGVGQLPDSYAYNLRYCEDMVCLDVGHMTLTDISFVEYMPNLKYLILAWTEVQYIEPIRTCKNLIWLELDNSCIRDYSPVADCTALEDLNIGNTFCDITPILEMTWLKNLYMIKGSGASAYKASQALPDTHVVATGDATVGGGWRRLQNYYDMRDCLGMYYMN